MDLYGTTLYACCCQSSGHHHHQDLGRKQRALLTLLTLLPCNFSVSIIYSKHIQKPLFHRFWAELFSFQYDFLSDSETSVQPQTL